MQGNRSSAPAQAENDIPPGGDDIPFMAADGAQVETVVDQSIHRSKITMATIGADPERAKLAARRVKLCEISGLVTGTIARDMAKTGEVFVGAAGEFGAVVYDVDGNATAMYKSGVCYLPGGFHEMLLARLDRATVNDRARGLAFALEFFAEPANNPRGYQYLARNLLKRRPQDTSPLDRLMGAARLTALEHASLIEQRRQG